MWGLPSANRCSTCGINYRPTQTTCLKCGGFTSPIRDAPPDSDEEIEAAMTEIPAIQLDPVESWRFKECLRIVGLDHAQEFAASSIDLHKLERLAKKATPAQLKELLL